MLRKLIFDKAGASAIEYGLLAAMIAVGALSSGGDVGTGLKQSMEDAGKVLGDGGKEKKDKKDKK